MEGCVAATPTKTPRSKRAAIRSTPRSVRRRSLFREESDLSDISPLSPSSDEKSPVKRATPRKQDSTPLKGMSCLSTLSLNSPEIRIHSDGPTSRLRGVNALKDSSPKTIPPRVFYGSQTEPAKIQKSWVRKVVVRAKTKLFLDDLPKNKKRARTGSGQKVQPLPKRMRRTPVVMKPKRPSGPLLGQTKSASVMKKTKKKSPQAERKQRSKSESPQAKKTSQPHPRTPHSRKDHNVWEISFVKPSRLEDNEVGTPSPSNRKFFKSSATTPTLQRRQASVLTPPASLKKQRSLCRPDLVYLSPAKSIDSVVKDITQDITEMMQDEPNMEAGAEINKLIDQLNQASDPVPNPSLEMLSVALPSPQDDEELPSTSKPEKENQENSNKLYPIFNLSSNKRPLSCNTVNTANNTQSSGENPKKKFMGMGIDQYQIDGGQRGLIEHQCPDCGLFYSKGCPEDEILHDKHHSSYNLLSYSTWKNEKVVGRKGMDKIIRVSKGDPKSWWNKVNRILKMVDEELGFPPVSIENARYPKVYLYIKDCSTIVGCLVCEDISYGHKLITSEDSDSSFDQMSEERYPVKCGVSRVWVHSMSRRSSVATCLVNSLRGTYCYGTVLKKEDIAFTVPTAEGKKFLFKYMGCNDYFVYA